MKTSLWRLSSGPEPPVVCHTEPIPLIPVLPIFSFTITSIVKQNTTPVSWNVTGNLTPSIAVLAPGTLITVSVSAPENGGPAQAHNGQVSVFNFRTPDLNAFVQFIFTVFPNRTWYGYIRLPGK